MSLADGVILATPEYNYSLPPVLKNALDWASRGDIKPFDAKHLAIMSASLSLLGGVRAQYHLRQVCVALNIKVLNKPEVFVMKANEKFDGHGHLIDEYTKKAIVRLMEELINQIREDSN